MESVSPPWDIRSMVSFARFAVVLALLTTLVPASADETLPVEQLEFFEKQVRPLLIQQCVECHGDKKQEAGLRLDIRSGFLKGSDSGPVFTAGNVDGSRLLRVVRFLDNETQMPPKGKLPDDQIAIVRKWLEMGAPWPAEANTTSNVDPKQHWAFQPIRRSEIPSVATSSPNEAGVVKTPVSQVQTPVDSFVCATLTAKNLSLFPPANRETFIRRATIDLWGIPPTMEQVQEFASDESPDAFERLIDRLLASPFYGQRWGRHWLDVARYADSKGYVFTAEPRYPYSYTYRDYVIDAFNADKPFDQFVIEQLAADMLAPSEKPESASTESHDPRLAAMGFLTVGRRYLNNINDIIDDRIDVVSRGFLGLTAGCARCHDHKFDPIPSADYYSLYGVFSSSFEPEELPVIGLPRDRVAYQAFLEELAKREAAILNYEKESLPRLMTEIRDGAGDSLQMIAKQIPTWAQTPVAYLGANEPRQPIVRFWREFLNRTAAQPHPVFLPWHRLVKVGNAADFPAEVNKLIESWSTPDEATKVNPVVRQVIIEHKPATLMDLARLYGTLLWTVNQQWVEQQKSAPNESQLPDAPAEQLRQVLYGSGSPAVVTLEEGRQAFGRDIRDRITELKRQADNLKVTSPGAPPRAMVMRDGQIREPVVFIRGNPGRHGKKVPRQFFEIATTGERKPFTRGSGRLELAQSIVDPQNPLTARVIVNRVWQNHFGTGIVSTPSDFGVRGMPPSHPELLDWLASSLAGIGADGSLDQPVSPDRWSLKSLHRRIMASGVYQQSAGENVAAQMADPENRLLWRMPRQRLDLEALRDSMLAVAGELDDSMGGQPFDDMMNPITRRRTVYALVNRNDLPGVFRAFDFADTDSSAAERPRTTVPQQSLFAMNSPFVLEKARRLAADAQASAADDPGRVNWLYQRIFARNPTEDERQTVLSFLASAGITPVEKLTPLERLAQVLLMTNEFSFVD